MNENIRVADLEAAFNYLASKDLFLWHERLSRRVDQPAEEQQGWAFSLGGKRVSSPDKLSPTVAAAIDRALDDLQAAGADLVAQSVAAATKGQKVVDEVHAIATRIGSFKDGGGQ